jgi:hypothetical protein
LLEQWADLVPRVQQPLIKAILAVLPGTSGDDEDTERRSGGKVTVSNECRAKLAQVLRAHYKGNKEAMAAQADLDMQWWASRKAVQFPATGE